MNLYVTTYPNDDELARALGSCATRIPLSFGDIVFWGKGDNDSVIRVCVERKKIGDLANSIIGGRYLYQAQSAKDAGMDVLILIWEVTPEMRPSPEDGLVEIRVWRSSPDNGKPHPVWEPLVPAITYSRLDQYLTELDYLAGIIVKRSHSLQETVAIIKALWVNFQTPSSEHQSLHSIYTQPSPSVLLVKPSLVRRVAKELPGIGWGRSGAVADHFRTVADMVTAHYGDWVTIDGIGDKTARTVVDAIRGLTP